MALKLCFLAIFLLPEPDRIEHSFMCYKVKFLEPEPELPSIIDKFASAKPYHLKFKRRIAENTTPTNNHVQFSKTQNKRWKFTKD